MTPEEAVRHAVEADMARIPGHLRDRYRLDGDALAAAMLRGEQSEQLDTFRALAGIGDPDFQPTNPEQRQIQDEMLKEYTGIGWTPEQRKGIEPQPYQMSPGAQMRDQIKERAQLDDDVSRIANGGIASPPRHSWFFATSPGAWVGTPKPELEMQTAANNYAKSQGRTHAAAFSDVGSAMSNPENWLGSYLTKMGPVISDGLSLFATSLLDGDPNTKASAAAGDAATRSYGADWNRTSPQLTQDRGWRENDALIRGQRQAYQHSEGMTSGDTFRSAFGFHVPYIQPGINAAMSFVNGLGDLSSVGGALASAPVKAVATQTAKAGIPVLSKQAARVAKDIGRAGWGARTMQELGDEAFDVSNVANTAGQFAVPPDQETPEQFNARIAEEAQRRREATKSLEREHGSIRRPQSTYQKYIAEPLGRAIGSAVGGLMQ